MRVRVDSLRFCVAGVGAVGGTIAARLAATGESVSLIARGARLAQLRRDGLRVQFDGTAPATLRLPVSDLPEFGIQNVLLLATKAPALPALLPGLGPLIGPQTLVAPLVNGIPWWYFLGDEGPFAGSRVAAVDPEGLLLAALPADRIVGCVAYLTSRLQPDGLVRAQGTQRLQIGPIQGLPTPEIETLGAVLSAAGLATSVSPQIRAALWTKVALNLATNPLSVVAEATLIEQFTDPQLLPLVCAVIDEALRVAAAVGVAASMSLVEMLATGRRAGAFETSMLQDYRAGRMLELDAIGRAVVELAGRVGLKMPTTEILMALCAHRMRAHGGAAVRIP
jgi:2-dehydropantoate 2-reductase